MYSYENKLVLRICMKEFVLNTEFVARTSEEISHWLWMRLCGSSVHYTRHISQTPSKNEAVPLLQGAQELKNPNTKHANMRRALMSEGQAPQSETDEADFSQTITQVYQQPVGSTCEETLLHEENKVQKPFDRVSA